jgi:hypothetical protein
MPDFAAQYTLSPPAGSPVLFNTGEIGDGTDVFFITDVKGLDSADLRTPQFKRPLAHGGYKPVPWLEDPLHPRFEGVFLVQTSQPGSAACHSTRIGMYHDLKTALRACLGTSTGTLTWTEDGDSQSLAVSYEVKLEHGWDPYPMVMTFTFGLFSEASQPS